MIFDEIWYCMFTVKSTGRILIWFVLDTPLRTLGSLHLLMTSKFEFVGLQYNVLANDKILDIRYINSHVKHMVT
jgi:hypothetical protein